MVSTGISGPCGRYVVNRMGVFDPVLQSVRQRRSGDDIALDDIAAHGHELTPHFPVRPVRHGVNS